MTLDQFKSRLTTLLREMPRCTTADLTEFAIAYWMGVMSCTHSCAPMKAALSMRNSNSAATSGKTGAPTFRAGSMPLYSACGPKLQI